MKALHFSDNKLELVSDHTTPVPGAGEALIRVSLAGICATDLEIVKGYMGFEGVPGHEFTGVVAQADDEELVGKRVVGEINCCCGKCDYCVSGLGRHCPERSVIGILGRDGAFAEYLTLPLDNLHVIPETVSDEAAVFVEPLAAAYEILEQVDIGNDTSVCVLGDGRLGLLAAQVLALRTPSLLTVGHHPEKLGLLAGRGIETATVPPPDRRFDVVVDCTGVASGLAAAMALVRPRGTVVLKTTVAGERPIDINQLVIDEINLVGSRCGPFAPAVKALAGGAVDVCMLIEGEFPLERGVEAFAIAGKPGTLKILLRP